MADSTQVPENSMGIRKKRGLPKEAEPYKFKPGVSGNPGGRPAKKPVTEMYERIFSDPKAMAALQKAVQKSLMKGNMAMVLQLKEMTDRVEGKVTQPIEADISVSLPDAIAEARKRAGR